MAPQTIYHGILPLRLVVQRLSSTPSRQLPQIAPFLARTIGESGSLLSAQGTKVSPDAAVLVHKLKTQISTLLQENIAQARWVALVLVKATLAAGGFEVLQGIGPWVRAIITILGKANPLATKKLCVVTLTSIFSLTHSHQSLVREITTPVLPAFITACVKIISSRDNRDLSFIVVQALAELLPHHPSSFRPFIAQIRACILPLIAPTPSKLSRASLENNMGATENLANCSRRMYALLSTCAPKKTESEEWANSLQLVVHTTHTTADLVFRSLVEDRGSSVTGPGNMAQPLGEVLKSVEGDLLGLPGWVGIDAGIERMKGLLRTLQAFISTGVHFVVALPWGIVLRVLNRILSLLAPIDLAQGSARINTEFGRNEREALLHGLPSIHGIAIDILSCMTERLGSGGASLCASTLQQCLLVLSVDGANLAVRAAVYKHVKQILHHFGLSVPLGSKEAISRCINLCCEDILPAPSHSNGGSAETQKTLANGSSQTNGHNVPFQSSLDQEKSGRREGQIDTEGLLPLIITNLADEYLAPSVRAQVDRTAILTQHEATLLASVLHPPSQADKALGSRSILPLLARSFPESTGTEALIRPRMPIVQTRSSHSRTAPDNGVENSDNEIHDSDYAQLYSGHLIAHSDNVTERRSFVEDSMQSERSPAHLSFASATAEGILPVETNTQRTEVSLLQVPETQPMSVVSSNKRDRAGNEANIPPLQPSPTEGNLDIAPEAPAPKKSRVDGLTHTHGGNHEMKATDVLAQPHELGDTTWAMPDAPTVPIHSVSPPQAADHGLDSDDSSIHIDPTLDTEDEDEDEDEDVLNT